MKTRYKAQTEINRALFVKSPITRNEVKRRLIHQLVDEMPLHKLQKVFRFDVLDPENPTCWEEAKQEGKSDAIIDILQMLRESKTIRFECEIII